MTTTTTSVWWFMTLDIKMENCGLRGRGEKPTCVCHADKHAAGVRVCMRLVKKSRDQLSVPALEKSVASSRASSIVQAE